MNNPNFIPLRDLLAKRSNQDWASMWMTPGEGIHKHFQDATFDLTKKLSNTKVKRVILKQSERISFFAAFLACLHTGKDIVLPHSTAPGVLEDLLEEDDLVLNDNLTVPPLAYSSQPRSSTPYILLYTSGSTGQPKVIKKSIEQLETEIAILEGLWGSLSENPQFISTVPHHHIYGLLFSLLWPACAGHSLSPKTYSFWEEIIEEDRQNVYVVSSPAHLSRMPSQVTGDFKAIFSSGSPLFLAPAQDVAHKTGLFPWEVFGSTETGGIAYRQQTSINQPWKIFPGIQIEEDANQCLVLKSPYLPDETPYPTQDRITKLDDQTFHLLGRVDDIVKIEGKRVSLGDIEQKLTALDLIQESAAIMLDKSQRDEIGVVASLTKTGQIELESLGKADFGQKLRHLLSPHFDQVALPRKWRFVEAIPRDDRGKRDGSLIREMFYV